MADPRSGGNTHGIPNDPVVRRKICAGLSDAEKIEFDRILAKIDGNGKPDRQQLKAIRKWKNQGKIPVPSKRFKNPSDRKTHP